MIVINRSVKSVGHYKIQFICVHNSRYDILFAVNLLGKPICLGIKFFCKFISAVLFKIVGVHIKYHFVKHLCVIFQPSQRYFSFCNKLIKILVVSYITTRLEMHIIMRLAQINICVLIVFVFSFVVAFVLTDTVSSSGLYSCHGVIHLWHNCLLSFVILSKFRNFFKVRNPH